MKLLTNFKYALISSCFLLSISMSSSQAGDSLNSQRFARNYQQFILSRSPDNLDDVFGFIWSARDYKARLEEACRLLGALESEIDTEFPSVDDTPYAQNIEVPGLALSNVEPAFIRDQKLRKRYENAININKMRNHRWNMQSSIHKIFDGTLSIISELTQKSLDRDAKIKYLNTCLTNPIIKTYSLEKIENIKHLHSR